MDYGCLSLYNKNYFIKNKLLYKEQVTSYYAKENGSGYLSKQFILKIGSMLYSMHPKRAMI